MKRRAAHLICESPKHPGKVANVALVAPSVAGWIPIRPENITGRNPKLRGLNRPGNVDSETVSPAFNEWARLTGGFTWDGPTHRVYRFRCGLCKYTLRATAENLDSALNTLTAAGEWRIPLHDLSATVTGK